MNNAELFMIHYYTLNVSNYYYYFANYYSLNRQANFRSQIRQIRRLITISIAVY